MAAALASLLTWFAGSLLARVLVGAGLSLVSVQWLGNYVDGMLSAWSASLGGAPASVLSVLEIAGLGPAASVIGSAVLARVAIVAASNVIGVASK